MIEAFFHIAVKTVFRSGNSLFEQSRNFRNYLSRPEKPVFPAFPRCSLSQRRISNCLRASLCGLSYPLSFFHLVYPGFSTNKPLFSADFKKVLPELAATYSSNDSAGRRPLSTLPNIYAHTGDGYILRPSVLLVWHSNSVPFAAGPRHKR